MRDGSRAHRLGAAVGVAAGALVRLPVALLAGLASAVVGALLAVVSVAGRLAGLVARGPAMVADRPRRTVTAVVTTFDGRHLLEANLPSVVRELSGSGGFVVVADDGSTDGTADWLAQTFPRVRVERLERNQGLLAACRRGLAAAGGSDLVFLLNNDVVLEEGCLAPMLRLLEDPRVFAVAPWIAQVPRAGADEGVAEGYFDDGVLSVQFPLLHFPDTTPPEPAPILFACGGAALYDRRMLASLGWDPLYEPHYVEDLDLGYRAWKRGATCLHTGLGKVEHLHQQTIGRGRSEDEIRPLIFRNELLFTWKNVTQLSLTARHAAWLVRRSLSAWLRDRPEDRAFRRSWRLALGRLGRALAGRFAEARDGRVSDAAVLAASRAGLWRSGLEAPAGDDEAAHAGPTEVVA